MLEVKAGTKEFVIPSKIKDSYIEKFLLEPQSENKHLFHQGLLLALMGERVSLYSLDRNQQDEKWTQEVNKLQTWLSDLEFKEQIKPYHESYHIQSFEQRRRHGVLRHTGYLAEQNTLTPLTPDRSKLYPTYARFIQQGLFDIFPIDIDQFEKHYLNEPYLQAHTRLRDYVQTLVDEDDNFDNGIIHLNAAQSMVENLKSIFKIDMVRKDDVYTEDTFLYEPTIRFFEENLNMKKSLNQRTMHLRALMFGFFTMKYLKMLLILRQKINKQPSTFGINALDMKSRIGFEGFLKWLNQVEEPLTSKRSINGATEFYKSCFKARYNVTTSAPTTNIRYDGMFHLYIKSTPEKEQDIRHRIIHGQNWITKVGKLCLGKLHQIPTIIPNSHWDSIN